MSLNQQLTQKVADKTTGMFKSMIGAIPGIGAFAELIMTIVEATGVFEPLQAVIDVIMGLFGIMGAQVIPVLMTAITPLIGLLMSLTPIFVLLGQVMGIVMQIALIPLILTINILTAVITPFLPLISSLIPIIKELSPIISTFTTLLLAISPVLLILVPLLELLTPYLLIAATWIGYGANALKDFNEWLSNVIDTITGKKAGEFFSDVGKNIGSFFGFQHGAESVPRTMIAQVDKGERIIPEPYVGQTESLLEEVNENIKGLRRDLQFQNAFAR